MDTKKISRQYLETLSSADLIALADDYGIDVPEDLNRRFLIGELLDVAKEFEREQPEDIGIITDGAVLVTENLPDSYNETQINVVLRTPVWAFVYWDIKESDRAWLLESDAQLQLRIVFFSDETAATPDETFYMQVSLTDREQYVLLRAGKKWARIDLVASLQGKGEKMLASSRKCVLPTGAALLATGLPGRDIQLSPLQERSSLRALLRVQYENHRQSFMEN